MNQKMPFEKAVARLEEIVRCLENGDQPLEESLRLFEEGSTLTSFCYKKLNDAEQKIQDITTLEEKDGKTDESD